MNLITHEWAYSLYPHATFEEHRSLVISTEGCTLKPWSRLGRTKTFEIPDPISPHAGFMTTNGWELKYNPVVELESKALGESLANPGTNVKPDGRVEPMLSSTILRTENLRFSYLVVDESVQDFLIPALLRSSEGGRSELQLSLLILTLTQH